MNELRRALSALNHLDPSCSRDEWVRIGMAAKAARLEFDDFHNWSKNASNYQGQKDCRQAWGSFDIDGSTTEATLFYFAKQAGWSDNSNNSNKLDLATNKTSSSSHNQNHSGERHKSPSPTEIWERCSPATPVHSYILSKQGRPDGLRYYPHDVEPLLIKKIDVRGYLVIPCYEGDRLQTLQFIPPNEGQKLNLPGGAFADGYFVVGEKKHTIYICEGLGQAWATYAATGCMSVVCFGSARMSRVTNVLHNKFPDSDLVILPDREMEEVAIKIAAEVSARWVKLPEDKPKYYDVNDYAHEYGYEALADLLLHPQQIPCRYQLMTANELMNLAPMRWLVDGVLPAQGLAAIYGPSMSGKSFLAIHLAHIVALGCDYWFGYRVHKAHVTYICLEGEAGLSKRIKALQSYTGLSIADGLRFVTQSFNLLNTHDIDELARAIIVSNGQNGMVAIDTLNLAAPGIDENSSRDMGLVISALKLLQEKIGGLVFVVHHTGKGEDKGPRGHSSLFAALDAGLETKRTENPREWRLKKSKEDESGKIHAFNLEVVRLGVDDDKTLTSCVVAQCGAETVINRRPNAPKSGNQKIIWDELGPLFKESRNYGKGDAASMKSCVSLEDAISKTMVHLPVEPARRKERAKLAIQGLVSGGYLRCKDGWLWCP